nr:MAG TPA: hypothetical protein [Caudoviricetes sp.]
MNKKYKKCLWNKKYNIPKTEKKINYFNCEISKDNREIKLQRQNNFY